VTVHHGLAGLRRAAWPSRDNEACAGLRGTGLVAAETVSICGLLA
jgi:hypothetical protein